MGCESSSCKKWDTSYGLVSKDGESNPKAVYVNKCTRNNTQEVDETVDRPPGTELNVRNGEGSVTSFVPDKYCGLSEMDRESDAYSDRPTSGWSSVNYCNFVGDVTDDGTPEWCDDVPIEYRATDNPPNHNGRCKAWTSGYSGDRDRLSAAVCEPNTNYGFDIGLDIYHSTSCDGLHPWTQRKPRCLRAGYSGDPVVCCFKDLECDPNDKSETSDRCFQTPDHQRTCDPKYQNLGNLSCRNEIKEYCIGKKEFDEQNNWKDMWKKSMWVNLNSNMKANTETGKSEKYMGDEMPSGGGNLKSYPPLDNIVNTRKKVYWSASRLSDDKFFPKSYWDEGKKIYTSTFNEQVGGFRPVDTPVMRTSPITEWPSVSEGVLNLSARALSLKKRGEEYPFFDSQPCYRAILRAVTGESHCTIAEYEENDNISIGNKNSAGLSWAIEIMNAVFDRYIGETPGDFFGGNVDASSTSADSGPDQDFQNDLFEICSQIPSVCEGSIKNICANLTKEDILNNPDKKRWCGCYLPDKEYEKSFVSTECQDTCIGHNSIPLLDVNGQPLSCIQNVCTINIDNLEIIGKTGGEINFSQLCPGCGESSEKYELVYESSILVNWVEEKKDIIEGSIVNGEYYVFLKNGDDVSNGDGDLDLSDFPTAKITIKDNKLDNLIILSKGTVKFNEKMSKDKNPVIGLHINQYYETGIDDKGLPDITTTYFLDSQKEILIPRFTTAEYGTPRLVSNYQREIDRCHCLLENVDISIINSKLKGKIKIESVCGKMDCFNDKKEKVSCSDLSLKLPELHEVLAEKYTSEIKEKYNNISYILLGTLIFISLFFLIFYYIYKTFDILFKKVS